MKVVVINVGLDRFEPYDHRVVVRTDSPDELIKWIGIACPGHSDLQVNTYIDAYYSELKFCLVFNLKDRDLMMFKLRWM